MRRTPTFLLSFLVIFFLLLTPHTAFVLNLDISQKVESYAPNASSSEPFTVQAELSPTQPELIFTFHIATGYHLYQSQFSIDDPTHHVDDLTFPPGESIEDPLLGPQVVYHNVVILHAPLLKNTLPFTFTLHYQGCKGETFCLPPEQKTFKVNPASRMIQESSDPTPIEPSKPSVFWTLLSFLGLGLLLSFSPCVLPILPIITGMLMASHQHSLRKEMTLSFAFVLGNTLILTLLGFGAVFLGSALQAWLQTGWFIIPVSAILLLMALSLLDYIHFHIPTHWLPHFKKSGSTLCQAFFIGTFSGLIFSPCVSAPLVGALMFITTTQEYWIGGSALFLLGIGMGLPLMAMAIFGIHILPKRGPWMHQVKVLFAALLLGLSIYLLSRIISAPLTMGLYSALTLGYGFYLLRIVRTHQHLLKLLLSTLGIGCLLYGISLFAGLMMGNTDLLHPLKANSLNNDHTQLAWITVVDQESLLLELKKAEQKKQWVIVDVYASWCIACHHIDQLVIPRPAIQQRLNTFSRIRFDITNTDPATHLWLKNHNVFGPPAQLFFDSQGQWVAFKTLYGEISVIQLLETLESLKSH